MEHHRWSNRRRARRIGFLARMRTHNGRKLINAKRRAGRKVQVV
jgi:ribosomal protein L34